MIRSGVYVWVQGWEWSAGPKNTDPPSWPEMAVAGGAKGWANGNVQTVLHTFT